MFIVSRPAVAIDPNVLESTGLVDRRVSDPEALFLEETGFYFYCADVNMTYASSEVRQKLVKSETLDYAMNLTVLEYIDNHSLYTL